MTGYDQFRALSSIDESLTVDEHALSLPNPSPSDARKLTARATSSGVPIRPTGTVARLTHLASATSA
jgi:hypothetical protein